MISTRTLALGAAVAALMLVAGAAQAASKRCAMETSGADWRVKGSALYGDAGVQGYGVQLDVWATAEGLKPGSNLQFNNIVGSPLPPLGWIRVTWLNSGAPHATVEAASPEVFSANASMIAGIEGKDASPVLKNTMRVILDGKSAFAAPATVVKSPADFKTSAVRIGRVRLGDVQAKDFHDPEAASLISAIQHASTVKVETLAEDGTVAGTVTLPRASIQAAMAARDGVMPELDRKLAAGQCTELKLNL
ncbi:MAG: hypothetical protein JSR45_14380 [Proteobacteria bacterium]|nr:hypothetical protein [Pseudomonadota bacterium]